MVVLIVSIREGVMVAALELARVQVMVIQVMPFIVARIMQVAHAMRG